MGGGRAKTRSGLLALAACTALALLAGAAAGTAPSGKSKSQWRVFGAAKVDPGRPLLGLAWAANRVWIIAPHGGVATLASARVSGRTLGGFAATRVPGGGSQYVPIVDGELVLARDNGTVTASLLANGQLGALKPISDDLLARGKEVVPKLGRVAIGGGARVGDRTVWALEGAEGCQSIGGCPSVFLVCCSESSGASDLTRFIDRKVGATLPQLGLDGRGRLWLAWLDRRGYSGAMRGVPRVLELDASTLAPRTKTSASPGAVADDVELACATSCRIVAQTAGGDIVSWAPGERSPTRVVSHWERGKWGDEPAWLLSASYRAGHLVVAYYGNKGNTVYEDDTVRNDVRVVRGDPRGARAQVVGATPITWKWPLTAKRFPPFQDPIVYGALVPGGLVALEHFRFAGTSSPVIYAFLPLRG